MEKQNLIEQLNFTFRLFFNIILCAFLGFVFAFVFNLDSIAGYKFIIFCALIGSINSVLIVLKRF